MFSHKFSVDIYLGNLKGRFKFQNDPAGFFPFRLDIKMLPVPTVSHIPKDPFLKGIIRGVKDMGQVHFSPCGVAVTDRFRAGRVAFIKFPVCIQVDFFPLGNKRSAAVAARFLGTAGAEAVWALPEDLSQTSGTELHHALSIYCFHLFVSIILSVHQSR